MAFERYAIYWAPPQHDPLAAFAQAWFGPDSSQPAAPSRQHRFGVDAALIERATASPRRYTLHATLKAPFRLAGSVAPGELLEALAAFAAMRRHVETGPLRLRRLTRYLALVPEPPTAQLDWLAAQCVVHFDGFRAPLSEADRARRPANPGPLETIYMEQFGYPYIFSAFEFHITLAGPLSAGELAQVEAALAPECAAFGQRPFRVEDICLFGDPGGGERFRLVGRFALRR